jgi:prolyl oligopeptidase
MMITVGQESFRYPKTPFLEDSYTMAGRTVADPLLWLTDSDDVEVKNWTAEQNSFTDSFFERHRDRLESYIAEERAQSKRVFYSGVIRENNSLFGVRVGGDGRYAAVILDQSAQEIRTLLDETNLQGGKVYEVKPCPGRPGICAFFILKDKAARMTVLVKDIERDVVLAELNETFSFAWTEDGAALYFAEGIAREDGTLMNRIKKIDAATMADQVIFEDPGHAVFVTMKPFGKSGMAAHIHHDYHAVTVLLIEEDGNLTTISGKGAALEYAGSIDGDLFFKTDFAEPSGRVIRLPAGINDISEAKTIFRQELGILEGAAIVAGVLVTLHTEHAAGVLRIRKPDGGDVVTPILPGRYGSVSVDFVPSSDPVFYFNYESFTCHPVLMKLDVTNGLVEKVYQSGSLRTDIVVERVFPTSFDGTKLTAFFVYGKNTAKNGCVPTLMYGYGGYNVGNLPASKAVDMDIGEWIDKGGLYIHCILRGGNEYGDGWHRGGNLKNKKNVFMDFAAIADEAIRSGWTNREHLAITGLSNGGLLVTATAVLYPHLIGCVLASVPHTDMLHFAKDDRGSMYITEYGDPDDPKFFEYMKSYSPYHNIRPDVDYPAFYIQTGELDNNVPSYHAKKFAAKMQALNLPKPVVLRTLPYASHDRGEGEYLYRTVAEFRLFRDLTLGVI